MIVEPICEKEMDSVEILRGPNIKPFPVSEPLWETIDAPCSLKVGDNITTDHIMPAGAKILPLRSNIPAISRHCFAVCDESFPERAEALGKSIIIGGSNYGQGSSREHAALAPLYLGVKAVITKSFARIHMANLINAGILPLTFQNEADYDRIDQGDEIVMENVPEQIKSGEIIKATNKTKGFDFNVVLVASDRQKDMLYAGGLLNYTKQNS
jgi:aconitate hydratase